MPSGYKHGDTPKKAMVRGTISYLESQGLPVNKSAIFRHFDLSRSQGYAALNIHGSKRNDPEWEETRGRPSKISDDDQLKMESILWDARYEDANLNWAGLAKEAGVQMECNPRTLHRTMGTLSYRRCLGCARCWVHKKAREKRAEYARRMLDTYPEPQDWRRVRFSGELHFGFGLDGKMRLMPRPGERFCAACAALPDVAWPRDVKRVHVWAAVGHGFKSELVFYDDSTSPNGTGVMTMPEYRDRVLDKAVRPWLAAAGTLGFVMEEDAEAFAHGSASKVNLAQQWKEDHGLRCYFTCGDSPDLSPLDSLWPSRKQWTVAEPPKDWEDETLRRLVRETWAGLDQERVNVWVDFMPQRLRQVVDTEGRMVPW
ncbi:hypothetical protein AK830_g7046 [Neonectria ditissima]|uniref:Uncharacterized protein n=1 Tax=Neonectria ditissima TaxID=78410 RepID=A0A0N8H6P1_9HYPO|nr:hypothetical protein AK830_g7046 [Neonectria ditissima]